MIMKREDRIKCEERKLAQLIVCQNRIDEYQNKLDEDIENRRKRLEKIKRGDKS